MGKRIIAILQRRDGMSLKEAESLVQDVKFQLDMAIAQNDYDGAETIMASMLGLEMDYIFDLIGLPF